MLGLVTVPVYNGTFITNAIDILWANNMHTRKSIQGGTCSATVLNDIFIVHS